jgi:calnexin
MQNPIECGGAYLKLLTHQKDDKFDPEKFDDKTPYTIMFGPDKCGATNKVHFIFRHKHPKTGQYEEKHLKTTPMARITKETVLYTLIIR